MPSGAALSGSVQQEGGGTSAREDPLQREKRLHAEQLQSLRERAAEAIEGNAIALEAAADEFERIALDASSAAKEAGTEGSATAVRLERIATAARSAAKSARTSAESARRDAQAARRRANRAADATRRVSGGKGRPSAGAAAGEVADARPGDGGNPKATGSIRTLNENDKHAAAKRTARQN